MQGKPITESGITDCQGYLLLHDFDGHIRMCLGQSLNGSNISVVLNHVSALVMRVERTFESVQVRDVSGRSLKLKIRPEFKRVPAIAAPSKSESPTHAVVAPSAGQDDNCSLIQVLNIPGFLSYDHDFQEYSHVLSPWIFVPPEQ